jgi:hypothetical protein
VGGSRILIAEVEGQRLGAFIVDCYLGFAMGVLVDRGAALG